MKRFTTLKIKNASESLIYAILNNVGFRFSTVNKKHQGFICYEKVAPQYLIYKINLLISDEVTNLKLTCLVNL